MSPGYLDISGGFTYTCPLERFPIKINLSPIALSAVFVESAKVRKNEWDDKPGWQAYGLSNANKTSKYEGGSSIQIDFDRTFGRKGIFRYRHHALLLHGLDVEFEHEKQIYQRQRLRKSSPGLG